MPASIVIAGFGPAGAATALAIHHAGIAADEITILDPSGAGQTPATGPDSRILALNAGSCRFLEALDVWPALAEAAHPMRSIAISDSGLGEIVRPAILGFDAPDAAGPLARLVPLGVLQAALRHRVREVGIPVVAARIEGVATTTSNVAIRSGGVERRAALLIGADGAQSAVRRLVGIAFHGWAYDQVAITGIVEHSGGHDGEAVQHFLPAGPFALLPLDAHRSSMVWSEKAAAARAMLTLSSEAFCEAVAQRAAGWRGEILGAGAASSHPLALGIARRFIGQRIALVADAAHVVHPLAGQGLNLGFADAATIAELVVEHCRLGLDPGDPALLEAYQRRRRPPALAMAGVTEGLNRLFSNDFAPFRLVRDLGLGLVHRSERLKSLLRVQAAGIGLNEPKLFRGEAL